MVSRGLTPRKGRTQVRRPPVRREAPKLRSTQIIAAVLMAVCLAGVAGVCLSPSFAAKTLELHGARFTSETIIRKILGLDKTPNLFRLETDTAAEQMVRLPAVESVSVQVKLPSTIVVTLTEREPKLVWAVGDTRYVVDQDGMLFGQVDTAGNPIASSAAPIPKPTEVEPTPTPSETVGPSGSFADETPTASPTPTPSPTPKPTPTKKPTPTPKKNPKATPTKYVKPTPTPKPTPPPPPTPTPNPSMVASIRPAPTVDTNASSGPSALALPLVFDRRSADATFGLGSIVDPVNLDAGYRIAGLTPDDVGSKSADLAVILDDNYGYTMSSVQYGWVAQFGFYTQTIRKVTVIPTQVRDLRSALGKWGENKIAWIRLVSDISEDHTDTVTLR